MTTEPPAPAEQHCLVVYVPAAAAEAVLKALGDAGAGRAGHYSHVAFVSRGTGRFTPLPVARPTIGEVGTPEEVDEVRIETLYLAAIARSTRSRSAAGYSVSMRTSSTSCGVPTSPTAGCAPGSGVNRPVPRLTNAVWE